MDKEKVLRNYRTRQITNKKNINHKNDIKDGNIFVFQGYISTVIVFGVILLTIVGGDGSKKILDSIKNMLNKQISLNEIFETSKDVVETINIFGDDIEFEDKNISNEKNLDKEGFIIDKSNEGQRIHMDNNREDSGKTIN